MKLKYYLRGLGIGVIVTTLILMILYNVRGGDMSDEDVIERAKELGMVMSEEASTEDSELIDDGGRDDGEEPGDSDADKGDGGKDSGKKDGGASGDAGGGGDAQGNDAAQNGEGGADAQNGADGGEGGEGAPLAAEPGESSEPGNGTAPEPSEPDDAVAGSEAAGGGQPEGEGEESYLLVIQPGDVPRQVCEKLQQNGLIDDAEDFRKYLSDIGYTSNMSVGEYEIPYGLSKEDVAGILQAGPIGAE